MKKLLLWTLGLVTVLFGFSGWYIYSVIKQAPKVTKQTLLLPNQTVKIYDKDDKLVYYSSTATQDYVQYKDIPQMYKDALLSTEDKDFFENQGFSFTGTGRAVMNTLKNMSTAGVGGGSTITQQLIKLSVFSTEEKDRTIKRKIQDMWLAYELTNKIPKEQVLEYYVNRMFEGQGVYGAQTIAHVYFGKDLKDLDLSQTAIIAGLGQAPSVYNLYDAPEKVENRRNQVLNLMYANGKVSADQAREAAAQDVQNGLVPKEESQSKRTQESYPNYKVNKDYIKSIFRQMDHNGINYRKGNLEIKSNLDSEAQQTAYDVVNSQGLFDKDSLKNIQTALTVMNSSNGKVIAQIGGRDLDGQPNQINRATMGNRSSGSVIKPILDYAPAIDYLGYGSGTVLDDSEYKYSGTDIKVNNWDMRYHGKVTMQNALINSWNPPAIRALEKVGLERGTEFMNQFGIDTIGTVRPVNAIGVNASTENLAGAYSAFSDNGVYHSPSYIDKITIDLGGNKEKTVRHLNDIKGSLIMQNSTAYIMNEMLKQVILRKVTAKDAFVDGLTQAGKSGTVGANGDGSEDNATDVWMSGYTPADEDGSKGLSITVWSGSDKPNEEGGTLGKDDQNISQLIYRNLMTQLRDSRTSESDWKRPDSVVERNGGLYPGSYD